MRLITKKPILAQKIELLQVQDLSTLAGLDSCDQD